MEILGSRFACVDKGFGRNKPVDVVIRPEDVDLLPEGQGSLEGVVTHMIFKGVHYEMEVMAGGFEWLVHSTDMFPIGTKVSIHVEDVYKRQGLSLLHKCAASDVSAD